MGCQPRHYQMITVPVQQLLVRIYRDPSASPGIGAWTAILQSLNLIPHAHLQLLGEYGYITVCKPGCPPFAGGGHNPDVPYVRLSHACLSEEYNRDYNITLLHEYGHIVDRRYAAMDWLQRNSPADYRLLASTGHEGATPGAGERFADCYMLYLMNEVAGRSTGHPADQAAYQGEQAQRRYAILRSTPAFRLAGGETGATASTAGGVSE